MVMRLAGSAFAILIVLYGVGGIAGQPRRTTVQDLVSMVAQNTGELYIVDVRPKSEYLKGTVPGAISVATDPAGFIADGQGGPVLLVSGADDAPERLEEWRRRLEAFGFSPIYSIEGGFAAWVATDGPVENPKDGFVKPGTFPFIIPRGICEMNSPAQVYE